MELLELVHAQEISLHLKLPGSTGKLWNRERLLFAFPQSIADFMKSQEIFLLVVHIKIRCSPSAWGRLEVEGSQKILEACLKYPMEHLPMAQEEGLEAIRQCKVIPASHD